MVPFPLVNLTVMAFSSLSLSLRDGLFSQPGRGADKLTGKVFREDLLSGQLAAAPKQAGRQAGKAGKAEHSHYF